MGVEEVIAGNAKTRGDMYNMPDPSPFEIRIMNETGATLGEVRALPVEDFKDILRECIRTRNKLEKAADLKARGR